MIDESGKLLQTSLESTATHLVQNGPLDDLRTLKYCIEDVTLKDETDVLEDFLYLCFRTRQFEVLLS